MKVFITGANGYLGARIFEYLSAFKELEILGGYFGANENLKLAPLNIKDASQTKEAIGSLKPDVVIHVAAVAHGEESQNTELLEKVNVQGTQNVVDAAKENNSKIIFLSTIGALHDMPYGRSKLAGEGIVKRSGLEYLILRPSVIIGLSPNRGSILTYNKILDAIHGKNIIKEDAEWKFQPSWTTHICEIAKLWLEEKFRDQEPVYPIIPETKSRFEISNDILKHFGLKAEPLHNPRYGSDTILTTESLAKNRLPVYHYGYFIQQIVGEINKLV